jgi:hypothetical protein
MKLIPVAKSATNLVATHVLRCATSPSTNTKSQGIDKDLRAFWDLESLGILKPERSVHDEFEGTITFKDGRNEVNLPWKDSTKFYRIILR